MKPVNYSSDSTVDRAAQRSAYAYVIPWKHLSSAKVLARLLNAGVRVRYQQQAFSINRKNFDAGTLVITKAANSKFGDKLYDTVLQAAYRNNDFHYEVEPVYTGFVEKGVDLGSNRVRLIQAPKIALLTGEGTDPNATGTVWHFFEQQLDYPLTLLNANDMGRIDLRQYNELIMPNAGNYRFLADRILNDQLKAWVRQGGKLIAMEGAVQQLANADWGLRNKGEDDKKKKEIEEMDDKDPYLPVKRYGNRVRENLVSVNSG